MKKWVAIFCMLLLIPTLGLARKSVPFMTGVIINSMNEVNAVQMNSPAYEIGLRPFDKIAKISTENGMVYSKNLKQIIDEEGKKQLTIDFLHKTNDEYIKQTGIIKTKKLNDAETRTTFLVKGTQKEVFDKIVKTIKFDPQLSLYLSMQSIDKEEYFITVHSSIDKHGAKDIGDYVTRFPSSAVKNLETKGNIIVGETGNPEISIVKINLAFVGSWDSFFSKGSDNAASSGIMERRLIERLYNDL